MTKKNIVNISPDIDFSIIGIVSNIKAYKVAFLINQNLNTAFKSNSSHKQLSDTDLSLNLIHSKQDTSSQNVLDFIVYEYKPNEHERFLIIKNKNIAPEQNNSPLYLVNEFKDFDYLFQINSRNKEMLTSTFLKKIQLIDGILLAKELSLVKIKKTEALIF